MNALLYLWQLPQNVLGLLITKILKVYWGKRYGFFFCVFIQTDKGVERCVAG